MKGLKHTKGPWTYQEKADAYTHIVRGKNNRFICQLPQDSSGEMEATARLIASSPDMLSAMVKTYQEFKRLRAKAQYLGDMVYLDGVLSVLDVYMVPAIEEAAGKEMADKLKTTARQDAER